MAMKTSKLCLLLFIGSLFLVSATLSLAEDNRRDPQREYQQCQRRCQQQEREPRQQQQCQQRCEEKREEQQREEEDSQRDPQREYQQCQRRCQEQERGQRQQQQCQQRCEERREERQREEEDSQRDPQREYQQCQKRCQQQERGQRGQQQQCQQRCEERREERQRQEEDSQRDPQKEYQQCQKRCQQQERGQRQQQKCQQSCEERREEREREEEDSQRDPQRECQRRCQEEEIETRKQQQCQQRCQEQREGSRGGSEEREEEQQQSHNPYFFDESRLTSRYRTEEGRISVLERFSRRSELLSGLDDYRLVCVEANPNTFLLPHHIDADSILMVVRGRGTITMVRNDNRDSFNLECGDIIRVPSGTTFYLVNRDNNEKLGIARFMQTIATPGRYEEYFTAGGQNPESYLSAFSNDILQAAFNTKRERLDRVLGQQSDGVIIRASQEQIKELTRHASEPSRHFHIGGRGETRGPYNLFNKRPDFSNNHGQLYIAKPDNYKQLQDMDVSVCAVNISQGAMMGPYYNTRSTKVVIVTHGSGHVEMACPHMSRRQGREGRQEEEEEEEGGRYEKIRARLSPRSVFIIPAGHPAVFVASRNENLQLIAFGINAKNNHENFLAGKEKNVLQQIERQALELAFAVPGREVEELINSQDESIFFPGPNQQHQRNHPLASIMDFVGF